MYAILYRIRIKSTYKILTSRHWKYRSDFKDEIDYIKRKERLTVFPYEFADNYFPDKVKVSYNSVWQFHYIEIDDKRLYMKKEWDAQACANYYSSLCIEQDYDSPHCYFTATFQPDESDVFIDIGCAEGKESLEIVDLVKELYLFECDTTWIEALNCSFAEMKDKVHIVQKFVGDKTNKRKKLLALDDFEEIKDEKSLFIKIDVEGAELSVLRGMEQILSEKEVRLLVATYHRHDDNQRLRSFLESRGYQCENSKNWMLFIWDKPWNWKTPYFRKGILRAEKLSAK